MNFRLDIGAENEILIAAQNIASNEPHREKKQQDFSKTIGSRPYHIDSVSTSCLDI